MLLSTFDLKNIYISLKYITNTSQLIVEKLVRRIQSKQFKDVQIRFQYRNSIIDLISMIE